MEIDRIDGKFKRETMHRYNRQSYYYCMEKNVPEEAYARFRAKPYALSCSQKKK